MLNNNVNDKVINFDAVNDHGDAINNDKCESYKKEQKERISRYIVGGTDSGGNKISKVYSRGDEYVIYEILESPPHESMRVIIDTVAENDMTKIDRFQDCKIHFDEFISYCYKYNCSSIYKKRAATVLSSIILGKLDPKQDNFKKINEDIKNDYENTTLGRNLYQLGAITLSLLIIASSVYIYLNRGEKFIKSNHFLPIIFYVAAFASMGGFISVSLKIKSLHTDRELFKPFYFFYGAERILFSIIAGVLVYFMLKGNIIFGFLNTESDISFSLYVVCALSGFSETLIPNALRNLETKSENQT